MNDGKTYDQHQLEAPLMTCLKCGKQYFSTTARTICLDCQPWVYGSKASRVDVSGNELTGP